MNDDLREIIKIFKLAILVCVLMFAVNFIVWAFIYFYSVPHVVQASLDRYFADYTVTN